MKCPKCHYLGFDTGTRCKNCGYDFSLLPVDLDLAPPPAPSDQPVPDLPLFAPAGLDDDQPLVKLPAAPRPPLAVRRTPDLPKARAPRPVERPARPKPEPVLAFLDDRADGEVVPPSTAEPTVVDRRTRAPEPAAPSAATQPLAPGGVMPRLMAAVIDAALLVSIDLVVLYLTLRIAALTWDDWRMLPAAPMLAFLLLIKLAYVAAFTTLGGQTIGKMAAGLKVVADDNTAIDPTRALRRTLASALSWLTGGAGFILALVAPDRRALHDRLAHTRVVAVRSI